MACCLLSPAARVVQPAGVYCPHVLYCLAHGVPPRVVSFSLCVSDPASRDDDPDISGLDVDLDQQIYERMSRLMGSNGEGMMWKCDVCNRRYKDKTKMRHHIETHLDSFVKCPICNQLCKTRRTLKTHIGRSHGKEAASAVNNMSDNIVKLDMCMEPKIELKS